MWPFKKREVGPEDWLSPEQARAVVKIFYADHDANCWYACARLPNGDGVRVAASSPEEAMSLAAALASEVRSKSGRVIAVEAGP